MAHKSITVSEDAYEALEHMKEGKESFTDVILRLSRRNNARHLLAELARMEPNEDLASSVERVYRQRKRIRPREVKI